MAEQFRVWAIDLPDLAEPFQVRDLPVDTLDALGAPYGLSWADVMADPAAKAGMLARIVVTVAELVGSDVPGAWTGRDAMTALEHLVILVDEESEDPEE